MRNDFEGNYLMHHGILGMHWGKRNGPPYPLTASQKSSSELHKKKPKKAIVMKKKAKKSKREDISKLSDQELRQRLNRMQMERQYKQFTESDLAKGKKFAKKVLNAAVMPLAVAATTAYISSGKRYVRYGAKGLYKGIRKGLTNAYTKRLVRRVFT